MPIVKNVALAPLDLPTAQLLRPGKTVEISDELAAHPTVVGLLAEGKLSNVDDAPKLAPPRRTRPKKTDDTKESA
ncbi:MAG: hypothetical protein PGN13_16080 [Patulibacter minatonensis]